MWEWIHLVYVRYNLSSDKISLSAMIFLHVSSFSRVAPDRSVQLICAFSEFY